MSPGITSISTKMHRYSVRGNEFQMMFQLLHNLVDQHFQSASYMSGLNASLCEPHLLWNSLEDKGISPNIIYFMLNECSVLSAFRRKDVDVLRLDHFLDFGNIIV